MGTQLGIIMGIILMAVEIVSLAVTVVTIFLLLAVLCRMVLQKMKIIKAGS